MSNQISHDKMCTLWEQAAETTGMKMVLSKDLQTYKMGGEFNKDQTGDASDTNYGTGNGDREYIPQEYRFIAKDGITSDENDFQDIIDRNIPVNRALSYNIPASISAKELADPQRLSKVAQGFAREIANKIDLVCYRKMIAQSTMYVETSTAFDFQQGIDAETLMLNRGLSAFDRKLFLSNKHYASVAKDLGQASRETFTADAISRAKIPDLATFDTMRSDYLINSPANATTGITVNGANQDHDVSTYDANEFYLDNRSQNLTLSGISASTFPVGTKFTIAGVNAIHPETREDTGELQQFTVITAAATTPVIQPSLVCVYESDGVTATPTGEYANCLNAPADAAAVTILNASADAPSLFYTPESTVIVPGRVPVIGDGIRSMTTTTENGIPLTLMYWYDALNMKYNMKAVVSFDVQVVYPDQLGAIYANQA
jgi:hypothetical protein